MKKEYEYAKQENANLEDQLKNQLNLQYEDKILHYEKKIEELENKISLSNQNFEDKLR